MIRSIWKSLLVSAILLCTFSLAAQSPEPGGPAMGECARDLLRTRLATAVAGDDVLSALAVETELLTLCRKRQELVASILENEERLAGLLMPPDDTVEPLITDQDILDLFEAPPEVPESPPPPPDYGWFSILGTSGQLRAGITDGQEVWWVREGSMLPGSVTIRRISSRPPGVAVTGADAGELPWRSEPGHAREVQ